MAPPPRSPLRHLRGPALGLVAVLLLLCGRAKCVDPPARFEVEGDTLVARSTGNINLVAGSLIFDVKAKHNQVEALAAAVYTKDDGAMAVLEGKADVQLIAGNVVFDVKTQHAAIQKLTDDLSTLTSSFNTDKSGEAQRLADLRTTIGGDIQTAITSFDSGLDARLSALHTSISGSVSDAAAAQIEAEVSDIYTQLAAKQNTQEATTKLNALTDRIAALESSKTDLESRLSTAEATLTQFQQCAAKGKVYDSAAKNCVATSTALDNKGSATCDSAAKGALFASDDFQSLALCTGLGFTVIGAPLGSSEFAAAVNCDAIKTIRAVDSGKFWVNGPNNKPQEVWCDMATSPATNRGANGESPENSGMSCANLKTYWGKASGKYYLVDDNKLWYCDMEQNPPVGSGDGSTAQRSSTNCPTLKEQWGKGAGNYYIAGQLIPCIVSGASLIAPRDCVDYRDNGQPSGTYKVFPDPNSPGFQVYCDQNNDGGGWAKIVQIKTQYQPTANAFGNIAVAGVAETAKLADTQVVQLQQITGIDTDIFRMNSGDIAKKVYVRHQNKLFSDPDRAWNVFSGTRETCEQTTMAGCGWCSTSYDSLDTIYDCNQVAEADRFFEQHSGQAAKCYKTGSTTHRCVCKGSPFSYAQHSTIEIWLTRRA